MFKHNEQIQKRSWLKIVIALIPIVIIFMVASFVAVNRWYQDNLQAVAETQTSDVIVVIETGTSVREIGDQLKNLGVIRNSTVFSWYVGRQDTRSELQAGTYRLNPGMDVPEIVTKLVEGDVATNLFTVLPGRRVDQLADDLIEFGYDATEVNAALNRRYDHPLFANLPQGASLEGYIFPDTYEITVDSTVEDVLIKSFDEFNQILTPQLRADIEGQGFSLHEAVTLASIVYKESGGVDDQRTIAQVFQKRLNEGMPLGADPTFLYAAAITDQAPSVDLDNPYNTRIYPGLPPGPISNFNASALIAVSDPAETDYLYFVAGDDGTTYFSNTLEEHEAKTAKYCIEACRLPDSVD